MLAAVAVVVGKDISLETRATDTMAQDGMGAGTDSQVDGLGWTGWILEENCLALKMSAELNVSVDLPTVPTTISSVPFLATVANTSSCLVGSSAMPSQVISLRWYDQDSGTGRHLARNISLQFSLDNTTSNTLYGISRVSAMYEISVNKVGPEDDSTTDGSSKFVKMTTGVLSTLQYPSTLHRSFVCQEPKTLEMRSQLISDEGLVLRKLQPSSVVIRHIQFDGFRPEAIPMNESQVITSCRQVDPTDLVPILVGGGLAGVVLFIVVGYLVGRRKVMEKGRGYSNV